MTQTTVAGQPINISAARNFRRINYDVPEGKEDYVYRALSEMNREELKELGLAFLVETQNRWDESVTERYFLHENSVVVGVRTGLGSHCLIGIYGSGYGFHERATDAARRIGLASGVELEEASEGEVQI